ncbi:short-chain dehydrogenase [Thozetella sp. PMI_491]|nr:short-chain dehydrogenase [Thozetella sp. PMI_491]
MVDTEKLRNLWASSFPGSPHLTEKNLPDLRGKVYIVTGASGGLGKELTQILYSKNAKIYIAARSEAKSMATIQELKKNHPTSKGQLEFISLDLNDLSTIKKSAETFLAKETRLDVLWNNAGVMIPPQGSTTAQGYELQLGVNGLGGFLFTKFLHPILAATAKKAPKNSVRVVWVSSSVALAAPVPAVDFTNMDYKRDESAMTKYGRSKAVNVIHAAEFARRAAEDGIISMSLDPGAFMTDLQRTTPTWMKAILRMIAKEPKYGGYTELFAGLSTEITEKNNGGWVAPYGYLGAGRKDLREPEIGRKLWEWTEEQVRPFL